MSNRGQLYLVARGLASAKASAQLAPKRLRREGGPPPRLEHSGLATLAPSRCRWASRRRIRCGLGTATNVQQEATSLTGFVDSTGGVRLSYRLDFPARRGK